MHVHSPPSHLGLENDAVGAGSCLPCSLPCSCQRYVLLQSLWMNSAVVNTPGMHIHTYVQVGWLTSGEREQNITKHWELGLEQFRKLSCKVFLQHQ